MSRFLEHNRAPCSEKNFSAHHLHGISTDPHVNHSIIPARSTNENPAGSLHFDTLLDEHPLLRLGHAVGHHPCRGAARRRAGSRILAVVKHHACMQARSRIHGLTRNKIEKLTAKTL